MTYTFATLEVSPAAYAEIRKKLLEAGYDHAITRDSSEPELIDMHGIALVDAGRSTPERERLDPFYGLLARTCDTCGRVPHADNCPER